MSVREEERERVRELEREGGNSSAALTFPDTNWPLILRFSPVESQKDKAGRRESIQPGAPGRSQAHKKYLGY